MDFIAIDLDKYDVWEAFRHPVPVKAQMYVKTANWNPGGPSEEVDCNSDNPSEVCYKDDRQPSQQSIGQALPSFGGAGPNTGHQDPDSNIGDGFGQGGLTEEQMECGREQKD